MRAPIVALAALLFAFPIAFALPGGGFVHATGRVDHYYVTTVTCEANAAAVVEFNAYWQQVKVFSDTPCVQGYYSFVGGCTGGFGRDIRCSRDTAEGHVEATLRLDGSFNLTWSEPHFYEAVEGQLERRDV